MATVLYRSFPAASFNWRTTVANGPADTIDQQIKTWILAVNENGANANSQIIIRKDLSASGGTRYGWTLELQDGSTGGQMFHWANSSTSDSDTTGATLLTCLIADWSDDSGNDGYGSFANPGINETGHAWKNALSNADLFVAYSSVPGQEFFAFSWLFDVDDAFSEWWVIYKDQRGHWAVTTIDATSLQASYTTTDTALIVPGDALLSSNENDFGAPFGGVVSDAFLDTNLAATGFFEGIYYSRNQDIRVINGSYDLANFADLGGGRTVYSFGGRLLVIDG